MNTRRPRYHRHRFPPEIISHAVWLYHRYCLSFRDVENLLAERGIIVSYETVRQWCGKFGPDYARQLKRRQGRLGDTWFLDEVFVTINGQRQYLWRAVDQDGDLIDILVQPRRDGRAARRFFRRLLKSQRQSPPDSKADRYSRRGDVAAFAKLCGACPIPASSGMTTGRHRLYRGGHRQANAALHRAVIVRMRYHSPTLNDVERRTAEGRPKREIIRCLKRFLARENFQRVMADYRARQAADLAA